MFMSNDNTPTIHPALIAPMTLVNAGLPEKTAYQVISTELDARGLGGPSDQSLLTDWQDLNMDDVPYAMWVQGEIDMTIEVMMAERDEMMNADMHAFLAVLLRERQALIVQGVNMDS